MKAAGTVLMMLSVATALYGISLAAPLVLLMGVVGTVIGLQLRVRASDA